MPWVLIAIGGALGAMSRYAVDRAVVGALGPSVLGTFAVNITGSFLLGLFLAVVADKVNWPEEVRMLAAVGFLGSYTTFSTLTVASVQLAAGGEWTRAVLNIFGSILIGLLAAFLGIIVGRAF